MTTTATTLPVGRALQNSAFRRLFMADTASQMGTNVAAVALPLVAVIALHASAFEAGLLVAAERAAFLVISLPAGVWVDRMARRPLMIAADLVRTLVLLTIPPAWWAGVLSLPQLYVIALGTGMATVVFDIAYQSYVPSVLTRDQLVDGNTKLEIVRSGSEVAGPMLGGWLIQILAGPATLLVTAIGYALSALSLGQIDLAEAIAKPRETTRLGGEIREGIRFVVRHPIVGKIVLCMAIANFSVGMLQAVQAIFVVRDVGVSPGLYGVLLSAGAVGALLGAAATARAARLVGSARLIWVALLVAAPGSLMIPFTAPGWRTSLFAVGVFLDGFGVVMYSVSQISYRQAAAPEHLLGRMNATIRMAAWGALPIGGLAGGLVGQVFDVRTAVWAGVIGSVLCVIPLLLSPLVHMRDLPESP
jgi:MFS family permease